MNTFKKNAVALLALLAVGLLALAPPAFAQVGPQNTVQLYNGYADTCLATNVKKLSIPVAITSNTTTQLVALATGKTITVCSVYATTAGTTTSLTWETGTGSACATGTTALTGAMLYPTAGPISLGGDGQKFQSLASNALCLLTAGTTSLQGVLSYTIR